MRDLVAFLVCACLVLQPLVLRLHLGIEAHTHGSGGPAAAAAHAHDHHGPHTHPHAHPHPYVPGHGGESDRGDDGGHPPHPAEDHLAQERDQLPVPPSPVWALTAAPRSMGPDAFARVAVARATLFVAEVPQRPPPRAPGQPRAPPAIA